LLSTIIANCETLYSSAPVDEDNALSSSYKNEEQDTEHVLECKPVVLDEPNKSNKEDNTEAESSNEEEEENDADNKEDEGCIIS